MAALQSGDINGLRQLLSSGPDLNSPGREISLLGQLQAQVPSYPLIWAVNQNNLEAVRLLLDSGADPNICCKYVDGSRNCWLRPLCLTNLSGIADMLLDAGADVNAQQRSDTNTETALLRAALRRSSVGKMLIERGADLNMTDEKGYTPLYRALECHNYDLVVQLIQAGAEVDLLCPPQPETTALKLALLDRAPNSLIQLLLQSGADPHLRDGWGHNALYWAGARQNLWAMKWFIAENVNMEPNPVSRSVVRFVNGMFLSIRCREFTRVLKYLRAMQIMVLHAHAGSSSITMLTGWQYYIKLIKGDIEASVKGLQAPSFRTYELVGEKLREICDMVNVLIDMSSNPFSLRHLCRVQIRSSLGRDLHRKVRQLDVPLSLQEYLKVYKECDIIQ